jgi:predicted RNA-binding protein YlxR (DUF448 family)
MLPEYVVERMDIASRKKFPLKELFRLVLEEGKLVYDKNHLHQGRGIYIHKDKEALAKVSKKNLLARYTKEDIAALLEEMEHDL